MNKQNLIVWLDDFNELAVQVGVKLVTILVPLPSAVALFNSMSPEVGWFGALIMALVIELFGLAAVDNNYMSWLHKDKVNANVSYAVTIGYVLVAESVIYAFKVYGHPLVNAVYMLFPLLSIMGFVLLMNRRTIVQAIEQEERVKTVHELNTQIVQLRKQVEQKPVQSEQSKVYSNGDILYGTEQMDTHDQIREVADRMMESLGKVNKSKIADLCGVSRTTVYNVLS